MPATEDKKNRTLTDDDIDAIVAQAERAFVQRFYSDLGRGVWGIVWKIVVVALVGVAAYGSLKGMK